MARHSPATSAFLAKQESLGFVNGSQRWRSPGRLYTWDALHGEVEVFNLRGYHLGVLDAITGEFLKAARQGRRIDV